MCARKITTEAVHENEHRVDLSGRGGGGIIPSGAEGEGKKARTGNSCRPEF